MLDQLGIESKFYRGDAKRQLQKEVEIIRGVQKKKVVCILDEAHLLEKETIEEFRFLLNYRFDSCRGCHSPEQAIPLAPAFFRSRAHSAALPSPAWQATFRLRTMRGPGCTRGRDSEKRPRADGKTGAPAPD